MGISVFLSYPNPYNDQQEQFIERIKTYLRQRGLEPRTVGVTDYHIDTPLTTIRRLMWESNGLLTIAFRRTHIQSGTMRPKTDKEKPINDEWLTTPWAHIEPAMAYQLGLPILILRQSGVIADGILERGIAGIYLPEFDLDTPTQDYLDSSEWAGIIGKWEGYVRAVMDRKGRPPKMF